jgi:hypothetical protein
MVGNMEKGICGSYIGIRNGSWCFGMKGDATMMTVNVGASEMYG